MFLLEEIEERDFPPYPGVGGRYRIVHAMSALYIQAQSDECVASVPSEHDNLMIAQHDSLNGGSVLHVRVWGDDLFFFSR